MADFFDVVAREINRALEEHFPADLFDKLNNDENKLRIIAEPGRYYACSAFTLCVNIIAKRVMNQSELQQDQDKESLHNLIGNNSQHQSLTVQSAQQVCQIRDSESIDASRSIMYYINDGVYASFNCLFYDHAEVFPILLKDDLTQNKFYKSSVWGPTCDGLDLVCKELYLPNMETGDFMVFKNMGAYTLSGAVAFNGIPLAKCIYVASTSWETIKEAFIEQAQDEQTPLMLNSSCHASASLAFQRALTGQSSQQILITCSDDLMVGSAMSVASDQEDEQAGQGCMDQNVDCPIIC